MQNPGAIRQKLKQVKWRYLKKVLGTKLASRPINCLHNRVLQVPEGDGGEARGLHICGFQLDDGSWEGGACDEVHNGLQRAQQCPHFHPRHSKDALKDEFNRFFETASLGQITTLYPMAAGLLWVLDGESDEIESEMDEGSPPEEEPASELPQDPDPETMDKLAEGAEGTDGGSELFILRCELLTCIEQSGSEMLRLVNELRTRTEDAESLVQTLSKDTAEDLREMQGRASNLDRRMNDSDQRIGDLSASVTREFQDLRQRAAAQVPASVPPSWLNRLLGRG